jgi:peptide/nickel transport system substrate-binding protein
MWQNSPQTVSRRFGKVQSRAPINGLPLLGQQRPLHHGIVYNTARPPFDNFDCPWALTMAIDIVEYRARRRLLGYLESGTRPAPWPRPQAYSEPMQDWLKEFTIDVGEGKRLHRMIPKRRGGCRICPEAGVHLPR